MQGNDSAAAARALALVLSTEILLVRRAMILIASSVGLGLRTSSMPRRPRRLDDCIQLEFVDKKHKITRGFAPMTQLEISQDDKCLN